MFLKSLRFDHNFLCVLIKKKKEMFTYQLSCLTSALHPKQVKMQMNE